MKPEHQEKWLANINVAEQALWSAFLIKQDPKALRAMADLLELKNEIEHEEETPTVTQVLDSTTAQITADLLELAAQMFSRNCSNQFTIDNTPENYAFALQMQLASDDPDQREELPHVSDDGKHIYLYDWITMHHCADQLRAYAEAEDE